MLEATIQGNMETLAKTLERGSQSANNRSKTAISRFLEIELMETIHQATVDTTSMKSLDRFSQSEAFISVLTDKLCRHMASARPPVESVRRATNNKIG